MPVHLNAIGSEIFFDLVGTWQPSQQEIELIPRPGVDGTGARLTGKRGKPFQMQSITYHTDFQAAADAMASYILLKDQLQTLTRNSITLCSVIVVDVTEASPPFAIYNVAGAEGAEACAVVNWTLVEAP